MTRAYNAISPISLNLDQSEGRNFLFNSGYDLRMSTYYAPDSTNLTDAPRVRSQFQRAIGLQNLERELDKLAKDPRILASMEEMYNDIKSGRRAEYDARDYYHNRMIDLIFQKARRKAWASIKDSSDIVKLIRDQRDRKFGKIEKRRNTTNILNIPK